MPSFKILGLSPSFCLKWNFALALFFFSSQKLISFEEPSTKLIANEFRKKKLLNVTKISSDPYAKRSLKPKASTDLCGIVYVEGKTKYITKTYKNSEDLDKDHAYLTHLGKCGTCSSLQDLASYMTLKDMTTPSRRCAFLSFSEVLGVDCFLNFGFSLPCAKTWYYNSKNTAKKCLGVCLRSLFKSENYNLSNGKLNPCLECDEKISGPIFKEIAGRTRRNSGLVSAIGRSPWEIAKIRHDYY
ncbi:MAG: hypothetical protein KC505_06665 [Myxococcales bacterium]|nr:hypothetical protein [Myxococcales bacterium]USN49924.1 MAG: hypothetical protein H6731_06485 [Myxococcales bacterium]